MSDHQFAPQHQPEPQRPRCPLCGYQEFQREEGRLDSKWGMTSHKLILLVCLRCRYVLHFYDSHSIWDFD